MRRRNHIRVDTFPFLAVLLCAMGSLILVLLVMDRRARIVAQARGQAQTRNVVSEREKLIAEREKEQSLLQDEVKRAYNRKRAELKAKLDAEQRALDAETAQVQARLAEMARELRQEEETVGKLKRNVQEEQARLRNHEEALKTALQEAASFKDKLSTADRARNKLAADLVKLEGVIRNLHSARERAGEAYSVVPYAGKQGKKLNPLYVECTAAGVVFHPDKVAMNDPSNAALRDEITRRLALLAARKQAVPAPGGSATEQAAPGYLMMLVRADGIKRYYQILSAIHQMPVEFGYEMVDADWVLSYPSDAEAATPGTLQPGTSPSPKPAAVPGGLGSSIALPGGPLLGGEANPSLGTGGSLPGGSALPSSPGVGMGVALPAVVPPGQGTSATAPSSRGADSRSISSSFRTGGKAEGTDVGLPPVATPLAGFPGEAIVGPAASSRGSQPGRVGTAGVNGSAASISVGKPQDGPVLGGESRPTGGPVLPSVTTGTSGTSGSNTPNPGAGCPVPRNESGTGNPGTTTGLQGTQGSGPVGSPVVATTRGGEPTGRGLGAPDTTPPAPKEPGRPRNIPLLPARVGSLGDAVVYIECLSDGVVVYPGARSFSIDSLNHSPKHNALYQMVATLFSRHKGNSANGNSGQQQLRFLIHRDAERTFHLTYPAFNGMAVSKTRYTLQPDDDVSRIVTSD